MNNGPRLNTYIKNTTSRDSLGIESIATSMQADLCPIINTVTPRPFYWAFMCFIYYDYYKSVIVEKRDYANFDIFLKRHDYYFVLSQLLIENSDRNNLVGIEKTQRDLEKNIDGSFECNRDYFVTRFGGMQYFNAGCLTMGLIHYREDKNGKSESFPHLTGYGEKIALAFIDIIKDTEFYKNVNYRIKENPVPKNVLIEYGRVINLALKGFDKCKELLKQHLFDPRLSNKSYDYALFLGNKLGIKLDQDSKEGISKARNVLFDYFSTRGRKIEYPKNLKDIVCKWEVVIGRQYFVLGLEMIWKYMLNCLEKPRVKNDWIKHTIEQSKFDFNINDNLEKLVPNCYLDFDIREDLIGKSIDNKQGANYNYNVSNGIKLILFIYNRFNNRSDFSSEIIEFMDYKKDMTLIDLINIVNKYLKRPIKDFLAYIMDVWLINKHNETAFSKIFYGRDGFYVELIDGYYFRKIDRIFEPSFTGIRFIQLTKVMVDLDFFNGGQ